MDSDLLTLIALGTVVLTSLGLLLARDWRFSVLILAGQYLGVAMLVWLSWPLEMAVVKVVAGWMAGAALGTAQLNLSERSPAEQNLSENVPLRVIAGSLVILLAVSIAPRAAGWVPQASMEQIWGALILIGLGLLQLGLTSRPLAVILGLLTTLSGFEIIYAAVESSILVAGLLAVVNLSLSVVGSYLVSAPGWEEAH